MDSGINNGIRVFRQNTHIARCRVVGTQLLTSLKSALVTADPPTAEEDHCSISHTSEALVKRTVGIVMHTKRVDAHRCCFPADKVDLDRHPHCGVPVKGTAVCHAVNIFAVVW